MVSMETLKKYLRVDYSDDDDVIQLMLDAVLDEMEELIPNFDRSNPTNRQHLLIYSYVKELYDSDRGNITTSQEKLRFTVQSMMLKEKLRGM